MVLEGFKVCWYLKLSKGSSQLFRKTIDIGDYHQVSLPCLLVVNTDSLFLTLLIHKLLLFNLLLYLILWFQGVCSVYDSVRVTIHSQCIPDMILLLFQILTVTHYMLCSVQQSPQHILCLLRMLVILLLIL